jgi:hypothetical protein
MAKAQPKSAAEKTLRLQAKEGFMLPVRYRGEVARVRVDGVTEFEVAELSYESKIHIRQALEAGEIVQVEGDSK